MLGSLLLALPKALCGALGTVGEPVQLWMGCAVLSGVHGTHLAEPGTARGTLFCTWWEGGQGCLSWVLPGLPG